MNRVYIIAEAGVNHNGSLKRARELVIAAAAAGADAVKFQTFRARNLVCGDAAKAAYQKRNTDCRESQFDMLRRLELDEDAHKELLSCCRREKIHFLSAAFDFPSIDLLHRLGLETWKIPSGEITNLPYLRRVGSLARRVILSSGMAHLHEIEEAIGVLTGSGTALEDIVVLHCNTQYPTPMQDVHLRAMATIAKACGVQVGYSDHTLGIEVPVAAVALGARVIEKHFTLTRDGEGPDHRASLLPHELQAMVTAIRNVEQALGSGEKRPSPSERENITVARKSIVASRRITAGEPFTKENLTVKRPGTGLSPMRWDELLDRVAHRDFLPDEQIVLP